MPSRLGVSLFIIAVFALGCQPQGGGLDAGARSGSGQDRGGDRASRDGGSGGGGGGGPIAYVDGRPIDRAELTGPLIEAAGGQVLAEIVLDRLIATRLERRGLEVDDEAIAAERRRVLASLSDDEDEATRLLAELRQRRGLGRERFEAFLRRNAALRQLVADRVEVDDATVRQEYAVRYGERYRVRVIVVDSFELASRLRRQALQAEALFSDLAARHSTDVSADRGGLLSPISPADPSYPEAIRQVLPELAERVERDGEAHGGRVSDVVAVDGQFALLRLEEKIEPEPVEFADVEQRLTVQVRRRLERGHMRQLARELLADANVTVLDAALGESWRQQRGALLSF